MKKSIHTSLYFLSSLLVVMVLSFFSASPTHAALVPYLSLTNNSGGSLITVTVSGADPNVSVLLYYPGSNSYSSINIGSTNANGYLMTTIDSDTYGIASNAPVYVIVDGAQSQQQSWPNYTASGSGISLSQSSVTLSVGQSTVVSASVSSAVTLSNNSNPGVASANISGNQITILGVAFGTSNITVCAGSIGCSVIQVSVSSSGSSAQTAISFSQSSVTLNTGQFQSITVSGSGSYYISANSNSGVVSANLSGSTLSLSGIAAGTASLSICSSNSGSTTCGTVNVTVVASSNVTNTNTTTATLSFSPSQVNLVAGQTQSATIFGGTNASTVYYVSNNQSPSVATANTNGTSVSLTGIAFGGDNITICQSGGPCGNLYVYVSSTNNTVNNTQTVTTTSNTTPVLSSFSISGNSIGSTFISSGNVMTLTFNVNQVVNTPTVSIGGTVATVSGSGSGPYTATYSVPSGVQLPLAVSITFTNPSGTGGQSYFWIGNTSSSNPSPVTTTVSTTPCPANLTCTPVTTSSASSGYYSFDNYLYMGMTPQGTSDPDVVALQKRLTADGDYSGPITGYFGPLTQAGVETYQTQNGLDAIGVVGPATRNLLNSGK